MCCTVCAVVSCSLGLVAVALPWPSVSSMAAQLSCLASAMIPSNIVDTVGTARTTLLRDWFSGRAGVGVSIHISAEFPKNSGHLPYFQIPHENKEVGLVIFFPKGQGGALPLGW